MAATESAPRRAERPGARLSTAVGLGLVVWGARLATAPLHDNSFFTHLATGRLILDEGSVPTTDPYSFTAPGDPWVVQSWLASVLYAASESVLGVDGLRLVLAAGLLAVIGAVWALTAPGRSLLSRLAVGATAVAAGSGAWSHERPLVFGLLGILAVLLVLEERLPPWSLLPVGWIWVNTHGSYPLGIVLLVSVGIGRWLDGEGTARERRLLGWAVGGLALGALNPLGPRLLVFPVELLGRREVLSNVVEWQAASFQDGWMLAYLVLVALSVIGMVRRPSWTAAVPFLVFVPLSLLAMRNIAVAVLVLVPGTARGLADLGTIRGDERTRQGLLACAAVGALAVLVLVGGLRSQPASSFDAYPIDALAHLDDLGALGDGDATRVITHDYAGNVLELLDVGEPVFYDDRFDMYPVELSEDYVVLSNGGSGWESVLARHDAAYVVWHRGQPLDSLLVEAPGWRLLWSDASFRAYCRRGAAPRC